MADDVGAALRGEDRDGARPGCGVEDALARLRIDPVDRRASWMSRIVFVMRSYGPLPHIDALTCLQLCESHSSPPSV